PGHEPAAERAAGAAVTRQPVQGRRREPVDLPLPQRRRGRVPRALGGGRPRDPRRDRPRLRAHLGRGVRAAAEAPGSREPAAPAEPCVELLVVDRARDAWKELCESGDPFGESLAGAPPWRAAEARLLAKRVDELTREGPWSYGDVVLLFRATTAMGFFERALDERGIPVHVVGGRGYWGQQQVADLRHWLAALANPLDGLALYSVLASP